MFGMKRNLDLGIILGANHHQFLSFDEYAEHLLLPFSPRFRNIDFAVSSLASVGINNVVIITKRDKDIIQNYLIKGWPLINFFVFEYEDLKARFTEFLTTYTQDHRLEQIMLIMGNYPVWFDMKQIQPQLEKVSSIAIKTRYENEEIISSIVVDKHLFIKRFEDVVFDEANLEVDIMKKMITEFKLHTIPAEGYMLPFRSLKEYYQIHMAMLEDYLLLDRFNAYVPIRGNMAMNISSNLGKGSHVVNSIVGENVEIYGKVVNSVIFSNVKIDKHAVIRDTVILPGNHIGSHAQITRCLIDEFSEDNTLPNIESYVQIGHDGAVAPNEKYPELLNFGVTLIGKDVRIPASTKIGSNCYIDSFVHPASIKANKVLKDGGCIMRDEEI